MYNKVPGPAMPSSIVAYILFEKGTNGFPINVRIGKIWI